MSRQRSVKRIFSFSSGTLNKLGIWGAVIGSARDRSARLLDLGARGGGHRHALHAELAPHVTHAEQLDRVIRPAHQPRPEQRVGRHLHTLGELIQVADVHDLGGLLERVGEAPFGDAPDERHLAALEPGPRLAARARGLALAAATGRLADPRPRPPPLADAHAVRAARRLEGRQADMRQLALGLRPPGLRWRYFRLGGFLAMGRRLLARLVRDRLDFDAALLGNAPGRGEALQRVDGGPHHVVRVRRAQALREDVAHAGALEHGAHGAARDHAGSRGRRLQQHAARAVIPHDLMRDRAAGERHLHHAASRRLHRLAHCFAHLVRLARRDADLALPVAHGDERVEPEPPAALHDLRDTVDRDDVLDETVALALPRARVTPFAAAAAATSPAPTAFPPPPPPPPSPPPSPHSPPPPTPPPPP